MSEKRVVKAAVVQSAPVLFDTAATLSKLEDLVGEAAKQKADIAVFPEAFVGGYPKCFDFGARLGSRSAEGREAFRLYFESAITVLGLECARIGAAARASGMHLVVGVIERDGATLYCSALTFGPDGSLLAKHRKLMPTALERIVWGQGDGSTLSVANSAIGKIGSVICWENYMPLLRMTMYAQGVELYCAPTVDDRETWLPTMRTIALEGRCFVLSASQFLTCDDCPTSYGQLLQSEPPPVLIRGGSCIVDPLGNVLLEPDFDGPCVRVAELDMAMIARGKYDLDVVGHYARPDVFHLSVDTTKRTAVMLDAQPTA